MFRPPPPPTPSQAEAQWSRTANPRRPLYRPPALTLHPPAVAAAPYPRLFAAELAARVAAAADFTWSRQQEEDEQRRQEQQRQHELMQVATAAAAAAVADQRRIQHTVRMQLQQEASERAQFDEAIAAQSFTPVVARRAEAQLRTTESSPMLTSPRLTAESPRVPPRVANRQRPRGAPVESSVPQLLPPRESSPSPPPPPQPAQAQVQSPRQLHSPTLQLPSRQRRTESAPVVSKSLMSTPADVAASAAVPEPPLQPTAQPLQQPSPSTSLSMSQPILQTQSSPAASPAVAPVSLSTTTPLSFAITAPVQRYRPPPTLLLPSRLRAAAAAIADAAAASQAAAAASSNAVVAPVAATSTPVLASTPALAMAAPRFPPAESIQPAESLNRSVDSFPLFAARPVATPAAALQSPKVHPLLQQSQLDRQSDLDLDFASPAPAASRPAQPPPASMPLHSLSATADTPASSTSLLSMSQPMLLSATAPASSMSSQTPSNKELEALFFGLDSDDDEENAAAAPETELQRADSLATTIQPDAATSLVNTVASTAPASLSSSANSRASSIPRSTTSSVDSLSSTLSPTHSRAANTSLRPVVVSSVPAVNDGLTPASSAAVILEKLERNLWGTIREIERSDSMLANLFPTERDREGEEDEAQDPDASGTESDSSRSSYDAHHSKRLDRTQPMGESMGDTSPVSQLLDMRSPGSLSSTGSSVGARPRPSAATAEFLRQHGTPDQKREQESLDELDRQMREQEEELRNLQQNYSEILSRRQESPNAHRTHRRPRSGSSSNVSVQAALVDEWPAVQPATVGDRSDGPSVRSSRRSSTQSYTPDVFFASHPNLPPNSPFHSVLSGQFSVEDDDGAENNGAHANAGEDDAPHERLDFASVSNDVSPPSRAAQSSHHRRMESADVLAEFERTIHVRGLDEERKSASPASAASFSRTMPRNAEQQPDQWALQSARRSDSAVDGFSAPIIMLATRSTDHPIVLYLDKVQSDGTIMRLCIHQHDNSQQLATLYLRCLGLPTTTDYTGPLSALIQRKISAFVASVQQERQSMEKLIASLRHKLHAASDDRVALVVHKSKVPTTKKKVKRKIKMGQVSLITTLPPVRQRSPSPPQRRHSSLSPGRRPTQLSSSLHVGMSPKSGMMRVGRAPVPLLLPPLMHPLPLPQPIRTSRSRKKVAAPATSQARARSASAPRRA